MQLKTALALAVAIVALAAVWVWYQSSHPPIVTEPLKEEFAWSFVDRGVNASSSMPQTNVALRIRNIDIPLGTYDGNCFSIAGSAWPLLSGEVSGAICYFAGGGTEIGVFEEGSTLVLKKGDVEEGDAEHAGFRGNFVRLERQPQL